MFSTTRSEIDTRASGSDLPGRSDPDRAARILIVDDEPFARQLLSDLLEAQGFGVVAVARGEEVFGWVDQVDLVLLDGMLPGRDGWSICRELKERHDPLLPVIMVTARTAPDDVVRTFQAGADDYVAKPFHAAELMARIGSRLRVRRAERALQDMNARLAELADQNYQLYERARSDAEDRALLLREIDHRVRNNFSVIMGLVSMERNRRPARPTAEALASLESRLRSFVLVYESLRRRNYRGVPVQEIVERMTQRLRNASDLQGAVGLQITGRAADLNERQAFALALALNELVTNALRHAFPDGQQGVVTVGYEDHQGRVRLEVIDDGVGMDAAGREVLGSGRSIVEAVVRGDLGGRVEYMPAARGTHVRLDFNREDLGGASPGAGPANTEPGSAPPPSREPGRYTPATPAPSPR